MILTEYLAPVVVAVSSNLLIDPTPRARIIFPIIILVCTKNLLSTPKIITFLAHLPFTEKF